jgi:hypothetical protein
VKSRENIFFTTGPPNLSVCKNRHERDKGLILIGGKDDKSHVWDSKKILEYIQEIVSSEPVDMIWTISSSPRTPEETEDQIQRFAVQRERVNFFRFSDTQKGWVEDQYDASSMVWVTADSMSMIYEALSAGCSVGIIPMKWKRRQNKFLAGEQDLYRKGLAVSYDLWRDSRVTPEPGRSINESDKCAREILRRWGLENSP